MLELYVIVPLAVAAVVSLLLHRHGNYIKYIALGASILSLIFIATFLYSNHGTLQTVNWFSISGYVFTLNFSAMPLNMLLLLIVGIVTPLIMAYSFGFMDTQSEQGRYYAEICVFAAAMMVFAIAGDFLTMFIGWELLGITSYLLIGFWYQRSGTAEAARKAITTILFGDIMMLSAMLIIWSNYHTFMFSQIINTANVHALPMEVSLILIMLAAFTKSAQFPFHEWLADAMKGPTPVSAFLHSSTMVKAGVFIVAVLLPLFIAYHLLYLLAAFGIITAFIGATNALAEVHIKRILAYSTMVDLGLMFVALGMGSLIAAMLLFVVQTFYKALLFMSAGDIMKANNNKEDIREIYNSPSYVKLFAPTAIGVASLIGLYPLSGFFGKAALFTTASLPLYALLLAVELISSLYIFRWLFVPMRRKSNREAVGAMASYRTLPKSMIVPIYILALLAALTGPAIFLYVPKYLNAYGAAVPGVGLMDIAVSITIAAFGIVAAFYIFYRNSGKAVEAGILHRILYSSTLFNTMYGCVARAFDAASKALDSADYSMFGIVKDGGHGVTGFGSLIKRAENGDIRTYVAVFIVGMLVILALFLL